MSLGRVLPYGCRITHGSGAMIKKPFKDIDITMRNLTIKTAKAFSGQLGWMEFNSNFRLPRHIHMDLQRRSLIDERILVLNGVGLVELAGEYYAVAPGSLVDIRGGVSHTWTACPAGVKLPDGTVSQGSFLMVYEYENETAFFPTASQETIDDVADYKAYEGPLDDICFPEMSAEDVVSRAKVVIDTDEHSTSLA